MKKLMIISGLVWFASACSLPLITASTEDAEAATGWVNLGELSKIQCDSHDNDPWAHFENDQDCDIWVSTGNCGIYETPGGANCLCPSTLIQAESNGDCDGASLSGDIWSPA